ncbi:MAG: MarR family transcriptional regulator [Desulfuromonadaceae bacterium]|nr:MarR family transcriptional regulator [Desulfuromonadaceae bacterium]
MNPAKRETAEVIDNLRRVFQAVSEYSRSIEIMTGLTGPQLWALKILGGNDPVNVSEVARQMNLQAATVVGILDRLEKKGLVSRVRSCKDRRVVELEISEAGRQLVVKAPEVAQALLLKGLDELTDEQFYSINAGMKQMVQILGAEKVVPQPLHC